MNSEASGSGPWNFETLLEKIFEENRKLHWILLDIGSSGTFKSI